MKKILGLYLVIILLLSACKGGTDVKTEDLEQYNKVVEVSTGTKGDLSLTFSMIGIFEPSSTIRIIPKVQGIEEVEELQIVEGQFVQKGDILTKIDDESVRDKINTSSASYKLSKENYEKGVESYNIAYENLKRTENLYESGAATKQDLENAQVLASENQLKVLKSQLDVARINYENQKKTLEDVTIQSPIDGIVSKINMEEKSSISTQNFIEIAEIDILKLRVKLPQDVVNNIEVGQSIDINVKNLEGLKKGVIKSVNFVPEDSSNLYSVVAEVENGEYQLKPGMFGEIVVNMAKDIDSLLLPVDSVMSDKEGNYVFIVENDISKKVYVSIGEDNGEDIEILEGIDESSKVVVSGQEFLEDGTSVVIVRGE